MIRFLKRLNKQYSATPEFWRNVIGGLFNKKSGPKADKTAAKYGEHHEQCFDLWFGDLRESATGAPVLIFFHGGGFIRGHRFYSRLLSLAHAEGVTVISAGYRMSSSRKFSIQDSISDAAALVSYLKRNASELQIDPKRIAVCGNSAGGIMSLSLAVNKTIGHFKQEEYSVVCACSHNSPTLLDPKRFLEITKLDSIQPFWYLWSKLFKAKTIDQLDTERVQGIIARNSPELFVSSSAAPVFMNYSDAPPVDGHHFKERLVSILHSPLFGISFLEKAQQAGMTCHLTYPGREEDETQIAFILRHLDVEYDPEIVEEEQLEDLKIT